MKNKIICPHCSQEIIFEPEIKPFCNHLYYNNLHSTGEFEGYKCQLGLLECSNDCPYRNR